MVKGSTNLTTTKAIKYEVYERVTDKTMGDFDTYEKAERFINTVERPGIYQIIKVTFVSIH